MRTDPPLRPYFLQALEQKAIAPEPLHRRLSMDETGATIKSTIVVYIVATTGNRLTTFSFAKAMEERLIQPASVLDSAMAIARLFKPNRLVPGGEMAEWLKATVC
jgi:hypothetical protein